MDDWLIENAIDQGLPLNTVVADSVFLKADPAPYAEKILITPVPHEGTPAEQAVIKALDAGCNVLLYGNTVYAAYNPDVLNGQLAWIRGSFPHDGEKAGALPQQLNRTQFFPVAALLRAMLELFGMIIRFDAEERRTDLPVLHCSMNQNAYYLTGYAKDTTVRMTLRWPDGAPLMDGTECILEEGLARYTIPKFWHKRCRFFATQKERSVVRTTRCTAEHPNIDERFRISGLMDATLIFRPPVGARVYICRVDQLHGSVMYLDGGLPQTLSPDGRSIRLEHLTGDYIIAWQDDHNPASQLRDDQLHPVRITETHR